MNVKCKCGSRRFVAWSDEDRQYTAPIDIDLLGEFDAVDCRCWLCNRDLRNPDNLESDTKEPRG